LNRDKDGPLKIRSRSGHNQLKSEKSVGYLCVNASVHVTGHAYVTDCSNSMAFHETMLVAKAVQFYRLCFEHA
jgi:hypothetical protein